MCWFAAQTTSAVAELRAGTLARHEGDYRAYLQRLSMVASPANYRALTHRARSMRKKPIPRPEEVCILCPLEPVCFY